jgi:hypothetical protein
LLSSLFVLLLKLVTLVVSLSSKLSSIFIISFSLLLDLDLVLLNIILSSFPNSKLLLISSFLSSIAPNSFKIISFLIVVSSSLFLDLVTILPTLEKVASEGTKVPKIAK